MSLMASQLHYEYRNISSCTAAHAPPTLSKNEQPWTSTPIGYTTLTKTCINSRMVMVDQSSSREPADWKMKRNAL
eukprot:scaffold6295_cov79-Skeletonema_marinoi.AAC.1